MMFFIKFKMFSKEKNQAQGLGSLVRNRRIISWFRQIQMEAPVGFEPTNQGFADPYNRPLCQGALLNGTLLIRNCYRKSR